jgi:hypothetical protein
MRFTSLFCLLLALMGITAAAQEMSFPVGPSYLLTSGNPMLARPIATPTLSLDTPLPPVPSLFEVGPSVVDQPYIPNPVLEQLGPDLFPIYYGYQMPSVVEIVSTEPPRELPASIVDPGVTGMTNAQSLRESGYGSPLGDIGVYWKTHRLHAPRVYTNADVERLHGS